MQGTVKHTNMCTKLTMFIDRSLKLIREALRLPPLVRGLSEAIGGKKRGMETRHNHYLGGARLDAS
jgi:hypothetical protein